MVRVFVFYNAYDYSKIAGIVFLGSEWIAFELMNFNETLFFFEQCTQAVQYS